MSDIPEGWVLLPKDPTPAMIEAAWRTIQTVPADARMAVLLASPRNAHQVKMLNRWRAMVAAAPKPPSDLPEHADANNKSPHNKGERAA